MSDYLTSLAARATGAAAAIRPRLASLYEPAPVEYGSAPAVLESGSRAAAREPDLHQPAAAPPPRPHTTIIERHTESHTIETGAAPPPRTVERPIVIPQTIVQLQQQQPQQTTTHEQQIIREQHTTSERQQVIHDHSTTHEKQQLLREHHTTHETRRLTRELLPGPPPAVIPSSPVTIAAPIAPEPRTPSAVAPIAPAPQQVTIAPQVIREPRPAEPVPAPPSPPAPARIAIVPHTIPAPKAVERIVREEPEAPEGPVINVTIGRIEVRAVPADPPARKSAALAERMSLDDYLRRRAERPGR
jgi:hypothetical protein